MPPPNMAGGVTQPPGFARPYPPHDPDMRWSVHPSPNSALPYGANRALSDIEIRELQAREMHMMREMQARQHMRDMELAREREAWEREQYARRMHQQHYNRDIRPLADPRGPPER
jgi:hypothetical protein